MAALSVAVSLYGQEAAPSGVEELLSPDGNLSLKFTLTEGGAPCYWLDFKDSNVILPSTMGFEFRGSKPEPKFGYGEKLVVRPYGAEKERTNRGGGQAKRHWKTTGGKPA